MEGGSGYLVSSISHGPDAAEGAAGVDGLQAEYQYFIVDPEWSLFHGVINPIIVEYPLVIGSGSFADAYAHEILISESGLYRLQFNAMVDFGFSTEDLTVYFLEAGFPVLRSTTMLAWEAYPVHRGPVNINVTLPITSPVHLSIAYQINSSSDAVQIDQGALLIEKLG